MSQAIWKPSQSRVENSNMWEFMQTINQLTDANFSNYQELHQWSINNRAAFWDSVWCYADIKASNKGAEIVLNDDRMPGASWFSQAKLNFAENLLPELGDKLALVQRGEGPERRTLTYAQLAQQVAVLAAEFRHLGVEQGDRVAGFMPNTIDTVLAMLATASIGAVWSACSPDFGVAGAVDRFGQIEPKLLVTTDGYYYNGKEFDSLDKVKQIADAITSVKKVVVFNHTGKGDVASLDMDVGCGAVAVDDFDMSAAVNMQFEQVDFSAPLYIMYSSGTTGTPKCIVHGVGGTLLQHQKELRLHTNVKSEDVLFYYTTCGWMMWNWLVSGLATGCTLVLYDGSPFVTPTVLMDIAEEEGISIFGTSAKYLATLEKLGIKPKQSHQLSGLHTILSTGSPLSHESYDYVYKDVKDDVLLASISGGTDIISCFLLGNPTLPVHRGELQSPGLGLDMDVFDEQGEPVANGKGELVCKQAFPSMPIGFWGDEDGSKYHSAYFYRFDNIWAHGDYAEKTEHGGYVIHGRSDAVLNPGGVRIGTAEIYRQVETVESVKESIVIGQNWQDDVRVVLFVVMQPGCQLDEETMKEIKLRIRQNTTPRHVPSKIIQVADIPRTITGKIVELAVRKVVHGEVVTNKDALANPEALDLFADLSALKS